MIEITADSLPRVMRCTGSIFMEPALPADDQDNTVRNEGIAADWCANAVFRNEFTVEELADRKAPNGVYIDETMVEHVAEYLSALDCGEVQADTSFSVPGVFRVGARCDHRKWRPETGQLTIDDLKYGWRIVSPEENWTLIAHAIGTCIALQIAPVEIVLRIHQPRPHHPEGKLREWRLSYAQLMEYYQRIVDRLSNPTKELFADVDQCGDCHALATCPAARMAGYNAITACSRVFTDDVSDEALAIIADQHEHAFAMFEARTKALRELVKHRVSAGRVVGNYAVETSYGHRKWKPGMDAAMLLALTGKDLATKPGVVTPAAAERQGVPPETVKALTDRPMTGKKLIKISAHKRAEKLLNK